MSIDGIAFIGPGSEWFWAMAQFLVLTVTGLAIYRQLRAQGSANALQAQAGLVARWNAPEMVRLRVATLLVVASGTRRQPVTLRLVGNFFAEMAALRTHRHLRPTDSWEIWSGQIQFWWALVLPWISEIRAKNSGIYGEFEELAAEMARLDLEQHVPNFDITDLDARVEREATALIARLQLDGDARRGVVPTWPVDEVVHEDSDTAHRASGG
jgi:hypothetical protein